MLYDVIILGGGPGGYKAAEKAAEVGLKVALIEEQYIGGTCLNRGCIPLKVFLHRAKRYYDVKNYELTEIINVNFNQKEITSHKNQIVKKLRQSITAKLKYLGIDIFSGHGEILTAANNESIKININNNIMEGKNLIIATGSKEITLVNNNYEKNYNILNSDQILEMEFIPKKILIIGAGIIGLEIADYYNSIGCNVIVIEEKNIIGAQLDFEISNVLKSIYEKKGINFMMETRVLEMEKEYIVCEKDDEKMKIFSEYVLMAIGRKANTKGYGLENTEILINKSGIITSKKCETTQKNIYACGDVNGKYMLAHTAYREGEVIINNIIGKIDEIEYELIPSIIYTNPEVASIGETEESCIEKGIKYKKISIPMTYSGRYFAENGKDDSICKIIIENSSKQIVGCHIIGNKSSEIILAIEIAMYNKMTIYEFNKIIFPHPTVGEIIKEAINLYESN